MRISFCVAWGIRYSFYEKNINFGFKKIINYTKQLKIISKLRNDFFLKYPFQNLDVENARTFAIM